MGNNMKHGKRRTPFFFFFLNTEKEEKKEEMAWANTNFNFIMNSFFFLILDSRLPMHCPSKRTIQYDCRYPGMSNLSMVFSKWRFA
jgi:hypothetical protein